MTVAAALTMASPGHAQTAPGEPPLGVEAAPPAAAPRAAPEGAPPVTNETPASPAPANPAPSIGQAPAPAPQDQTASPPPRHTARHTPEGSSVAAKVNLRRGPTTDSEIVATIPAGSAVRVGQCDGEWCAVTWNGQRGYAVARNLNIGGGPYPEGQRQAGIYPRQPGGPGYPDGDGPAYGPDVAPGPGYHYGPPVVYGGPAYYYGPRAYYYGRPWGWRYGW